LNNTEFQAFRKELADLKGEQIKNKNEIIIVKETCDKLKNDQNDVVVNAFMKLDKDFANFEKKSEESQQKCENEILNSKQEMAKNSIENAQKIETFNSKIEKNTNEIIEISKKIQEFDIKYSQNSQEILNKINSCENSSELAKNIAKMQAEFSEKVSQISIETKNTTCEQQKISEKFVENFKKQEELDNALKFIKLDLSEKIASVDKSILNICETQKMSETQKNIDLLKKGLAAMNTKIVAFLKDQQLIKQTLSEKLMKKEEISEQKLSGITPEKSVEFEQALKELESTKQKMAGIQKKIREIDLQTSEANRVTKLNIDNLALQVKNLELSRSLMKLEKFTPSVDSNNNQSNNLKQATPNLKIPHTISERRLSASTNIGGLDKWKTIEKENENKSFSIQSIKSEQKIQSEIGINTEENANESEKLKEGRRMVVKLLKKPKLKLAPSKSEDKNIAILGSCDNF